MTRADIATAALTEQVEQRIRIAISLLPAYRIRAQARAWDGTRCTLLVADVSDAYGRRAFEVAKKRGMPMLLFNADAADLCAGVATANDGSPAPVLAQSLRDLLVQDVAETAPETIVGGVQPALCRLTEPEYSGRAVDATYGGRLLRIRPGQGRVYAPTFSDLLSARDSFSSAEWTLSVSQQSDDGQRDDGASRSLEAFLLQSAFQGRDLLPAFPEGRYRLREWPDVGSAPELIDALKVAKALLRAPGNADELRRRCGMDARDVNASLWAYRAANLLDASGGDEVVASAAPAQPVGAFSGMLARIATRFGLGNA
jgi:hypothetical protein